MPAIVAAGGVEALVKLVTKGTDDGREEAAPALVNLGCGKEQAAGALARLASTTKPVTLLRQVASGRSWS